MSGSAVSVQIRNPVIRGIDTAAITVGEDFPFGRDFGGVARISDDPRVSRRHGIIHATADGLSVSSTSTSNGFVVRDRATPSRIHVPCTIGPVVIPFRECSIVLEHCVGVVPYLDVTVIGSTRADEWHNSWRPEMRHRWRNVPGARTRPPLPAFNPKLGNGRPYAWFATLVALCEPQFGVGPAGTPTNAELARRLYVTPTTVERHLTEIYRRLELHEMVGQRELAVTIAISLGIVTPEDLRLLP